MVNDPEYTKWERQAYAFAKKKRREGYHAEVSPDPVAREVRVTFVKLDEFGEEIDETLDIESFHPETP